jgi:hypothetical protein
MWLEIYQGTDNRNLKALVVRQIRLLKLEEGLARLQQAVDRFRAERERDPVSLAEVVRAGYIERFPEEPYGGRFYLSGGRVESTTPPGQRQ